MRLRRQAGFYGVFTACLLWTAGGSASAQSTEAHISGRITDATTAAISGASVCVLDMERRVERCSNSTDTGYYRVPFLKAGRYRVVVKREGFRPINRRNIILAVGQVTRLDLTMEVGVVTETVDVATENSLTQYEKAEVSQVIDGERIEGMPLNGRNYLQLAQLSIGVLPSSDFGRGHRAGDEGSFTAVGLHASQNVVLLDGSDNSSRMSGGAIGYEAQAVKPPVDAVKEFTVVTNNSSAEYGYRSGAKVLVSTKSGTNALHGSLYEFFRNSKLDGTNFFANRVGAEKPEYRRNQFGGTLGGPIVKDRTFFFISYQGTRVRRGQSSISTVPSLGLRTGITAAEPWNRRDIFDPGTLTGSGADAFRLPFANNVIPKSRWDPVAANLLNLYPKPNIEGRENRGDNFFHSASDINDSDQYDMRADHDFGSGHRAFVRYSIRNNYKVSPGPLPMPADGGLWTTTRLDGDNVTASVTSALSNRVFNDFRFGYFRFPTRLDIPYTKNLNKMYGILGAPGDTFNDGLDHGLARFVPSGFAQLGSRSFWPNQNDLDSLMLVESIAWQAGAHSLKFGAEFRRARAFRNAARFRRGVFNFNGVYTAQYPEQGTSRANTGNGIADMLLGTANREIYGNAQGEDIIIPYGGFYVQDDWKVTPHLTLNLGLRYEVFPFATYPHPEKQTVGRWLVPEYNAEVGPGEERMGYPADGSDRGATTDWNNFAPRIGIAYRLTNGTVFRAGGGIYYGEHDVLTNGSSNFRSGPPQFIEITNDAPRTEPTILVREGFSPFRTGFMPENVNVHVYPDFRPTLYSGQWFFDVQQRLPWSVLLTAGYNGQAASHLTSKRNINHPLTPDAVIHWKERRVRPQFNNVTLLENSLNSSYNSLTVKAEKRFSEGLTFISSFTWAHNIDSAEEDLFVGGSGRASIYELWRDRGSSSLDRRYAWTTSFLVRLPFGEGQPWLNTGAGRWLLSDWTVGSILSLLSGLPVDHSYNVDHQNNGGRVRGDWVSSPDLPEGLRSIDRWFDTGFVTASAPGVIGNAGRNLIRAPGRADWDLVVSRTFPTPWESHELQFRFEAFNFTNSAHFGPPNQDVGSPNAGAITAADEPRRIQFGLKYVF